jgi:ABC-type polysaccharide/polyol phosphate transport system ATPase subunit
MREKEVITVENLSKEFPIYTKASDLIYEVITGKCRHEKFWALKNISFTINEKQRVGIIGPNGSGKSTLLKIITGYLRPTAGSIKINGQISAMLSLTSTLNPEETGLNNIRFNLILNGCKKSEVDKLTDEIIEFTELGPFIYSPVKTYSSGMNARLAFAIATSLNPEILVVDEVLSVGDAYFVGKATKRMIELCERGKALLFVSHSTNAIQMLCDTVIWLDNGNIREMGPTEHILKLYEEDYRKCEDESTREANIKNRKVMLSQVHIGELENPNLYRLRVVSGQDAAGFLDVHYIRKITLAGERLTTQNVSLTDIDVNSEDADAFLDLHGSEWGRLYTKDNSDCRILSSKTGKKRGGQIIIKRPPGMNGGLNVRVTIETTSIMGKEDLYIEYANYITGEWVKLGKGEVKDAGGKWRSISYEGNIPLIDDEKYLDNYEKIKERSKPDLEITGVRMMSNGRPVSSVKEAQAFSIDVDVIANRVVPRADVGIKIIKSDGTYVFWQSSGMNQNNLENFIGKATISFLFNDNYFSGGEYYISAYCANGWDIKQNYPYSEVYDRKVNAYKFIINREYPLLDFGQINLRVPVLYIKEQGND